MKNLFFDEWNEKRVKKIIDVLGKYWFKGKTIHDLGCAHGEVGEEFLRLGAHVEFSDLRQENLDELDKRFKELQYKPISRIINQEEKYNLSRNFDLLIHFGLLYNIKNWKQDLECALKHSNMMFLESIVIPKRGHEEVTLQRIPKTSKDASMVEYVGENGEWYLRTPEVIEDYLTELGCKFISFDDPELNTAGWMNHKMLSHNIYDWNYDAQHKNIELKEPFNEIYLYRKMWLVIK